MLQRDMQKFSMNCRLVAGMPAETSQRPSGVTFSLHAITEAVQWKRVECCFLRDSAEGYRQKISVEDGHMAKGNKMIACLTYA